MIGAIYYYNRIDKLIDELDNLNRCEKDKKVIELMLDRTNELIKILKEI